MALEFVHQFYTSFWPDTFAAIDLGKALPFLVGSIWTSQRSAKMWTLVSGWYIMTNFGLRDWWPTGVQMIELPRAALVRLCKILDCKAEASGSHCHANALMLIWTRRFPILLLCFFIDFSASIACLVRLLLFFVLAGLAHVVVWRWFCPAWLWDCDSTSSVQYLCRDVPDRIWVDGGVSTPPCVDKLRSTLWPTNGQH